MVSGLHNNPEMVENFNSSMESAHEEEVGDTNNEHVGAVLRGYPVMDECSRMDFSRGAKSKEKPSSSVLMDSVQETWRRIRGSHTDLRQYVTLEEKNASQVLKLAYGMCNLLSEADELLGDCHQLICVSLFHYLVSTSTFILSFDFTPRAFDYGSVYFSRTHWNHQWFLMRKHIHSAGMKINYGWHPQLHNMGCASTQKRLLL